MSKYRFEAMIYKAEDMDAAYITFPYDVEVEFGVKGQVKVKAVFDNRVEYRGSLAKMGLDRHCLGMTKQIRQLLSKNPGDIVSVELQKDNEPRDVEIPEDVKASLLNDGLDIVFQKLSYTKKKEYIGSISAAKKPETRVKRLSALMDDLKKTKGTE